MDEPMLFENVTTLRHRLSDLYNSSQFDTDKYWVLRTLPWEDDFDQQASVNWMRDNWTWSLWISVLYVLLVYGGRRYMQDRPAFNLQKPLEVWNWSLAIFSIMGSIKVIPYLIVIIQFEGFRGSVCSDRHHVKFFRPGVAWLWLFCYSKVVELGDTAFIILRKRPLIFLHWYHHITVLIYTWFAFSDVTPMGLWFISMNYAVHAFMYTYYSLRSMSIKIPRMVSMAITLMQIMQMIMGCYINYMAYVYRNDSNGCQVTWWNVASSCIMYGSYWILFCWFFYKAYIWSGSKKRSATSTSKANGFVKKEN